MVRIKLTKVCCRQHVTILFVKNSLAITNVLPITDLFNGDLSCQM